MKGLTQNLFTSCICDDAKCGYPGWKGRAQFPVRILCKGGGNICTGNVAKSTGAYLT